jgi:hypothetical protein
MKTRILFILIIIIHAAVVLTSLWLALEILRMEQLRSFDDSVLMSHAKAQRRKGIFEIAPLLQVRGPLDSTFATLRLCVRQNNRGKPWEVAS